MNGISDDNSPLFIVSAERSGSTLLRYVLDTQDDIGSPGEIGLGELCSSLMRVLSRLRLRPPSPDLLTTGSDDAIYCEIRQLVSSMMSSYLQRVHKRIWCDKTPFNLQFISIINSVFPTARYICLYRSCLDYAASCLEASRFGLTSGLQPYAFRFPENFVRAMVESWAEKTEAILAVEKEWPARSFRIRYEDFVCNAESELGRLCEFLNLPWTPEILSKAFMVSHYAGGGDYKIFSEQAIHQRSVGAGKNLPVQAIPPGTIHRINQLLELLRYPVIEQPNPAVNGGHSIGSAHV